MNDPEASKPKIPEEASQEGDAADVEEEKGLTEFKRVEILDEFAAIIRK